jgi:hypothetical protein
VDNNRKRIPSYAAQQMASTAANNLLKQVIYDEAYRCENRLSALVSKMKSERVGRGLLTIIGGGVGIGGGLAAAVMNEEGAKTAGAVVAALGSLVALSSQLVGEPGTEMELYQTALRGYEAARAASLTCTPSPCIDSIRKSLVQCSDASAASR